MCSTARLELVLSLGADRVIDYTAQDRWLGPLGSIASGALLNLVTKQRITLFTVKEDAETLEELRDLIEAGQIKPVIDSEYSLERTADAIALVKDGRPAGKVAVTVAR